jgi:hypothetical protein
MCDAASGAFGAFFTQSPSFLDHHCDVHRPKRATMLEISLALTSLSDWS